MDCPAVYSGSSFLGSTLAYIDCQAQTIGTFGFQALSAPNSVGATILFGLLTLFVAVFGYRLVFGQIVEGRDVVGAVLRIGIVLTLATSWAAFRTVAYETVLYGPAEVAREITGFSGLSSSYELIERLQNVDTGIVALTVAGTGREETEPKGVANYVDGRVPDSQNPETIARTEAAFAPIAVNDQFGMGFSRVAYLAGTLAPLAILRVGAGLLLGLAPLFAGLLLFESTRSIFLGWFRALVAVALGSLAMIVSLSVELALLEPWLTDVLARRQSDLLTPSAPTELVVITISFAVVGLGLLVLFARLAFNPSAAAAFVRERLNGSRIPAAGLPVLPSPYPNPVAPSRAAQVAARLTTIYRGERGPVMDRTWSESGAGADVAPRPSEARGGGVSSAAHPPLGSSYRRTSRRASQATSLRDRAT